MRNPRFIRLRQRPRPMTRQAMTAGPERPELDVVEEGRRCGAAEEAEDDGGAGVRPAANPLLLPVGWVGMAFGSPNLRATTSCSYVATSRPTCTSAEGETRIRRRPCHHNNIKSYHIIVPSVTWRAPAPPAARGTAFDAISPHLIKMHSQSRSTYMCM